MKNYYFLLLTVFLAGYWINVSGQPSARQGEILITEIMANPEAVSDANGEWIEIWNSTTHDLLISGLTLKDAGSNEHVLNGSEKLVIPAGAYWVLARNGDPLTNGGVKANYVYQNFTLSNTSDQVILTAPDGTLIDQVSYGPGWPVVSGASMELQPESMNFSENDQPEHWLPARIAFGAGDKGSPGKANPVSSGLEEWEQGIRVDIFPNPSAGRFILEATFSKPQSGEIRMMNLVGQDFFYKSFSEREILREVIEPDLMAPGIWFVEVNCGIISRTTRLVIEK
jgi:hypothetical protein